MDELTRGGTASDFGMFARPDQTVKEGFDGRVEAGGAESGLIEHPPGAGMTSPTQGVMRFAPTGVAAIGSQAQISRQLVGIFAGGEAVGDDQQPGSPQQANAGNGLQTLKDHSPGTVAQQGFEFVVNLGDLLAVVGQGVLLASRSEEHTS